MLSLLKVLHKAVFQLLPASSKRVVIPTHSFPPIHVQKVSVSLNSLPVKYLKQKKKFKKLDYSFPDYFLCTLEEGTFNVRWKGFSKVTHTKCFQVCSISSSFHLLRNYEKSIKHTLHRHKCKHSNCKHEKKFFFGIWAPFSLFLRPLFLLYGKLVCIYLGESALICSW